MVQTVKIKRSSVTATPTSLQEGELAYSSNTNRLFIGRPGSGSPGTVDIIGGKLYVDMLDHTAGTLTASSAIIVDASSKIDVLNVDNITINGNSITSTDVNGNIAITPNGTGDLVLDGLNWPQSDGSPDQFLKTNGAGQLSWATSAGSSFSISDGSSPDDVVNLGETLSFLGTANEVETNVTNNTVTIGLPDNVTIGDSLTVTGNLTVMGTTTTVNSNTVNIDDPIFTLGAGSPIVDDNKDRGIEFYWNQTGSPGLAKTGFFGHDDSSGKFIYIPDGTNTSEVFSGTLGTFFGDFEVNSTLTLGGRGITGLDISTEFTDSDAFLMTAAAIDDRILSYGYADGDITQVTISSTDGSLSGTGVGSTGDIAFDLEVALVDGGTF